MVWCSWIIGISCLDLFRSLEITNEVGIKEMRDRMSKVPEIDYRLWLKDETKGEFVKKLGDALSDIGFFSLSNPGFHRSSLIQPIQLERIFCPR